ncbi:MAG: ABC transporter permease [Chloroflexota bacterium]
MSIVTASDPAVDATHYYDSARVEMPMVRELRAVAAYRDLVRELVARSIKTRYKRSVLGVAWTMLNPLMIMLILTAVFSSVFRITVEHYAVYFLSAVLLWNFFSQTAVAIANEIVWGGSLLTRIYVPPGVFAASALGAGLVNIVLSLVPLAIVMLITGVPLSPALIFLPLAALATAMFAVGVGLLISRLAIVFSDVLDMFQILLLAWMYCTPIMYPLSIIDAEYRWLMFLNPMYYMVEMWRQPVYSGLVPSASVMLTGLGLGVGTLVLGWWYFTGAVDEIAYRV